ncbi:hypothetical protein QR680_000710 [Steinernema hermaphroditum]|uniref:Uncharacterized protein n=1 Tax=Steinernema hermaphroditum TaxID=289476 RepID=A0AA39LEJ9_9BILA|nr:hypothetical protein QR680_000710 [Steinernema hermaphroditum]
MSYCRVHLPGCTEIDRKSVSLHHHIATELFLPICTLLTPTHPSHDRKSSSEDITSPYGILFFSHLLLSPGHAQMQKLLSLR